jgi:hypothetical protein
MKFRTHHIMFIAFLLVFTALKATNTGSVNQNLDLKDLEGSLIITEPRIANIVQCDGEDFRSIGLLSTGGPCELDSECHDFWPTGPSWEFRERSICCVKIGECGEFI